MSSATHMQIFSILPCRWAGFLFLAPWPAPWLFSQNAPAGRHSHALRYPHANFQPPSMSLGWIFILGVLAPWPPLDFFRKTHPQVVIPMPSATHMQNFSFLACRSAGFLFWGFWPPGPPPWLFSPNAPTNCHSHTISYPHANFQPPSMSFGWIFIFGPLARPLAFFTKRTHKLSFPCHQLHTCKFSAS